MARRDPRQQFAAVGRQRWVLVRGMELDHSVISLDIARPRGKVAAAAACLIQRRGVGAERGARLSDWNGLA